VDRNKDFLAKDIQAPTEFIDSEFRIKTGQTLNPFSCPHITFPAETQALKAGSIMQLGQNQAPFIKSCPCPVTPLSNGICLAFGVTPIHALYHKRPLQQAVAMAARHLVFSYHPPNPTLTILKSATATFIPVL
jgi:hypothetical protein